MELLSNPELWVGVGFVVVIGILLRVGVPKMVAGLLDARAAGIKAELDEARRLREEAEGLLANLKAKAAGADREAQAIVDEAKGEAERFAADARAALTQQIARRAQVAQDKIAQAETTAMAEIRALAADAAAAAAEKLIAARLDEKRAAALIEDGIKSLSAKLN
ncbi:MAG TPA: ATP F0F1 synthase subunit B [Rhizomicrobium sp.]|nr:ATP F0F1 synthase subunit B [Rhizomicrobium sp.]